MDTMDTLKLVDLLGEYIVDLGAIGLQRSSSYNVRRKDEKLSYIIDMSFATKDILLKGEILRPNRWLGFIQGTFWSHDVFTIDEMRDHSRPIFK